MRSNRERCTDAGSRAHQERRAKRDTIDSVMKRISDDYEPLVRLLAIIRIGHVVMLFVAMEPTKKSLEHEERQEASQHIEPSLVYVSALECLWQQTSKRSG